MIRAGAKVNEEGLAPDVRALRYLLGDLEVFSRIVIGRPLREYQLQPMRLVAQSVLHNWGLEFLLVFPRQSGKNEAAAQLLVYLLNLLQRRGGSLVFGATGEGLGRGRRRLIQRLDNPLNRGHWLRAGNPQRIQLGKAAAIFMSTHSAAATRGETADWLLVIDEMQDQDGDHIEAVFEPMRAASNASALYLGTVKSRSDALWRKKLELQAKRREDGQQRVFIVTPEEVTGENPAYGLFLEEKVRRLGRHHPIVASEYFNEPLDGTARLFDDRRLGLMSGEHLRQYSPKTETGAVRLATLDVGGQDEAATDPLARLANPGRDYSVAHVFEADSAPGDGMARPVYRALDVFVDQGSRHFQAGPGQPSLAERLLAWLRLWQISHLVVDESGVGGGLADYLARELGPKRVTGFTFTTATKAELGSRFLSLVETGRFRYWRGDVLPLADGWWFWAQARACTYELPLNGRFEKDLRWGVPNGTKVDTPIGRQLVHDDRLISAALVAVYDRLLERGEVKAGQAGSAIIPPRDPLKELGF